MNKRQVIILWVIALLLCASIAIVKSTSRSDTQAKTQRVSGNKLFQDFPAKDVAAIDIAGAENQTSLTLKDGTWSVANRDGYPANVSEIHNFLRKLADLTVTQALEAGPSFAPRFGIDAQAKQDADHGLTVALKDASGKQLANVSFGKEIQPSANEATPFGGGMAVGRYVQDHADETGFYAINDTFSDLSADPARWVDQNFFTVEKPATIETGVPGKEEVAWKVTRQAENAEFVLSGAKPDEVLDTGVSNQLKNLLMAGRFEDVVPAADVDKRWDKDAARNDTITTFEGFTYRLAISPDKAPAQPQDTTGENAPPPTETMLVRVDVSAEISGERAKGADEKPEDAKKLDEAFAEKNAALQSKLDKEKALAGHTFVVPKYLVEVLLKDRASIITKAQPAAPAQPGAATSIRTPGGAVVSPPASTQPVEVYTPPVSIPSE